MIQKKRAKRLDRDFQEFILNKVKVVDKGKRKEFIWKFLNLYSDIYYFEIEEKDETKSKNAKKEIFKLLPDYHYLFEDIDFLYKIYIEYFLENPDFILKNNFKSFMGWVFEELYNQKVVDKEVFGELKNFLNKFNIKSINLGQGLAGGGF